MPHYHVLSHIQYGEVVDEDKGKVKTHVYDKGDSIELPEKEANPLIEAGVLLQKEFSSKLEEAEHNLAKADEQLGKAKQERAEALQAVNDAREEQIAHLEQEKAEAIAKRQTRPRAAKGENDKEAAKQNATDKNQ